jgi:hypothetical protein
MTISQPQTSFAQGVIKKTSTYLQSTPLTTLAQQYAHPKFSGRLTRSTLVADANGITVQCANNLLRYCYPLEKFFLDIEKLMIEQELLANKLSTAKKDKNGQLRLRDLTDDELITLAGNYHNVKAMSERNDNLRKHLTKRGLINEVRLAHPSLTTSQAYIGLNKTLIVKSV